MLHAEVYSERLFKFAPITACRKPHVQRRIEKAAQVISVENLAGAEEYTYVQARMSSCSRVRRRTRRRATEFVRAGGFGPVSAASASWGSHLGLRDKGDRLRTSNRIDVTEINVR